MAIPSVSGDDVEWRGEEFRPAGEFWPHTILPLQYFPPRAPRPETRLMAAILEDALRILLYQTSIRTPRRRRVFVETERWFRSNDKGWPFAFVNVCDTLGLDVGWLRGRVYSYWTRDRIAAAAPRPRPDDSPPPLVAVDVRRRAAGG
jgi:hypothetical protein